MDIKASIIPRKDESNDINAQIKVKDEMKNLYNQISHLQFIIGKYNKTLGEYQKKYGNEIFLQIENELNNKNNPEAILLNNESESLKKYLLENIKLFVEYEAIIKDLNNQLEFLNKEITNLQVNQQKLSSENEELRKDLEKSEKDKNEYYKIILDRKKTINFQDNNIIDNNNYNLNDDNSNLENNNFDNEKQKLIEALEANKAQNEYNVNIYNEMKEKYDNFINEKENYDNIINNLTNENEFLNNENVKLKNLINEKVNKINDIENEKNEGENKINELQIENNTMKKNLNYIDLYNEMEQRKNNEIEGLQNEINSLKIDMKNLRQKNKINEEKISNLKYENTQLKSENSTYKSDCDHLTKIIEDSNIAVQNASNKENNIDNIIKRYKKRINDIILEKEKSEIKIRMQDEQIRKLSNDYSNLLKEKSDNFNILITTTKDKYDEIIQSKDDEINHLKTENLSYKMDKDKYYNDYKLIKSEYDKINNIFHNENENYMKQYEQSKKDLNIASSNYENKLNELNIKNDKLESENNSLKNELLSYISSERSRQDEINKFNQNEIFLKDQIGKLKEKVSFYTKENNNIMNEKDRQNKLYDLKIKNLKENYEMKIISLENTINFQKNQLASVEQKAFDMMKRQEGFTEKLKQEYNNTIDYYENLIANITNNTTLNDDEQSPENDI
jgi:chromosome segregation ATPase